MDEPDNQEAGGVLATKPVPLPDRSQQEGKTRRLTRIGFALSFFYLGAVVAYWFNATGDLLTLTPNEFGDFLAGTFAPLAFLWLVFGFLQQGHELRHSADALWLQGEELRNSVEQQRELVKATREQLAFDSQVLQRQHEDMARRSQPIFKMKLGLTSTDNGAKVRTYEFVITNFGRPCTDVEVLRDGENIVARKPVLATGDLISFRSSHQFGEIEPFDVVVFYLDEQMVPGSRGFSVSGADKKFTFVPHDER